MEIVSGNTVIGNHLRDERHAFSAHTDLYGMAAGKRSGDGGSHPPQNLSSWTGRGTDSGGSSEHGLGKWCGGGTGPEGTRGINRVSR